MKQPTYRERREAGGWTLVEISALAAIDIMTLNRIELGKIAKPHRATLLLIEAALTGKEAAAKKKAKKGKQ